MGQKKEQTPRRIIECRNKSLELGKNTLLMGILNITPDSFSDGGRYIDRDTALIQARNIIEEGADILDIGGESTRPGHLTVDIAEEWSRIEPVLTALLPDCPIPVSIDTQKAKIAEKALQAGAHMINDIWGLQQDPEMANVVAAYQAAIIIMHNQAHTGYRSLMGEILRYLSRSIEIALQAGIRDEHIILDPGIGFGKTSGQNMEVISRLEEIKSLGFPILLGVSRKSVIGRTLNLPTEERLEPTIALNTLGIAAGVDILRVHDIIENKKAALMTDQIVRYKRGEGYEGK